MAKSDCDNPYYFKYWHDESLSTKLTRGRRQFFKQMMEETKACPKSRAEENYHWVSYEIEQFTTYWL